MSALSSSIQSKKCNLENSYTTKSQFFYIAHKHQLIYSKDTCILLDVGEGSMGQIRRFYGDDAENVIKKLKAIYISHLHADHHMGLFGILQMRQEICDETYKPILLLAPNEMEPWIMFYKNEFEKINTEFEFIDNRMLVRKLLWL